MNESNIYIVAGKEFELQHHGVKGMKWGKRKKYYGPSTGGIAGDKYTLRGATSGPINGEKYTTGRQGMKNANAAGREAWQKTTTENGGKLVGKDKNVAVYKNPVAMRRGRAAAQTARNDAIKESIKNDKAANKAERQRVKAEKEAADRRFKDKRAEVSASRSRGSKVATVLLAGPFANKSYNAARAAGASKAQAMATTAIGSMLGGPIGNLVVAQIYKSDSRDSK